ncbi:MAG TPA: hypothetical protein VH595_20430 [Verrucomicrobiae bacterium]|nr:hypothetical protein [Verrucomicrobiae bacterium]
MGCPRVQQDDVLEGFQAAGALAIQRERQIALDQDVVADLLDVQIKEERVAGMGQFIEITEFKLGGGQFAFEVNVLFFQMAEIDLYRHGLKGM